MKLLVALMMPAAGLRLVATREPVVNRASLTQKANKTEDVVYRHRQNNFQNMQYFADFQIGTPGQTMSGIFDTGSFDLLVLSAKCQHCPADAKYDSSKSSSFVAEGTPQRHCYGSGCADAVIGFEKVSVGPLAAPKQAFWEITNHEIPIMDFARFQAIVGVGHSDSPSMEYPTMLQNFGIDEFAFCLEKGDGAPGWLYWGGEPHLHASMAAMPVVANHHWGAILKTVGVRKADGTTVDLDICNPTCSAIIDSGTSLIAMPQSQLKKLEAQIGYVAEDCSNIDSLPTLTLNLGGNYFELPPRAYIVRTQTARVDTSSAGVVKILTFQPKVEMVTECMHSFFAMDQDTQHGMMWILGDPWLRTYYTVYNRPTKTMYAAPAGADCRPAPYVNFMDASEHVNVTAFNLMRDELNTLEPKEPVMVNISAARNPWKYRLVEGKMEI
mmetsp:Transcript_26682/g.58831  ORF Transcript_26682/g.58831 Transcript_26682/m.58831 type:complete len:440 (+) Transcript_26682:128-1447(+)|eukprot:CAMPEP_0204276890 /NCGR_PEP_ID=MMETSP0468-20130131/28986_1 /ASSEMBLY_ACC=CAM_ASM_000383 /TAXON_ID=2969 /ORGANISM="Oxyrrhis marina" /LENGTH=439 /DNA_ID=CAMNT_0051253593 /DNA_START=119 /DNA_END=1438 /DNA_ORIENTATION=+